MTRIEELRYLYGLQREALKWTVTDGDNAVELEVNKRIEDLLDAIVADPQKPACKKDVPSEARLVPGLSYAQYKYRMRKSLDGLGDDEIRAKYEEYKAENCSGPVKTCQDTEQDNA